MAAPDVIASYLAELPGSTRHVAAHEWGLTLDGEHAEGWPLEIGLRLAEGLLTVRAHALVEIDTVDPWMLLWWNRSTRYVRFAATEARELWVHADLPAASVDTRTLDRVLGLVVEAALAVRSYQRDRSGGRADPTSAG